MNKIRQIGLNIQNGAEIYAFFFLLTVGLLFGDGLQSHLEVFVAVAIWSLYVLLIQKGRSLLPLPRLINIAWCCVIVYYGVRGAFSDSVAYSLSSFVRLIEGYLVYWCFYSLRSKDSIRWFMWGLLFFAGVAIATSLAFVYFIRPPLFIPNMNLLYAVYGHNYLASILVVLFPLLETLPKTRIKWLNGVIVSVYFFVLIATFARGAWAILIVYIGVQSVLSKRHGASRLNPLFLIGGATLLIFELAILVNSAGVIKYNFLIPSRVYQQINKTLPWQDGRVDYWKQALQSSLRSPWFGSGPGTFNLLSVRFQNRPLSYSWFAHSLLLQAIAELGIIGALLFFFLFAIVWNNAWNQTKTVDLLNKHDNVNLQPYIFYGALLLFIYGFYDMVFDFLVIWLIFWAALGLLSAPHGVCARQKTKRLPSSCWLGLATLGIYYLLCMAQFAVFYGLFPPAASYVFVSFNTEDLLKFVHDNQRITKLTTWQLTFAEWIHKGDPSVYYALAQSIQDSNQVKAREYYLKSLLLDPENTENKTVYYNYLSQHSSLITPQDQGRMMSILFNAISISNHRINIDTLKTLTSNSKILTGSFIKAIRRSPSALFGAHYSSKFLYFWALESTADRFMSEELLREAVKMDPDWSYFHIELASFMLYEDNNATKAQEALRVCQQNTFAAEECSKYSTENLPKFGSYANDILHIF